MENPVAAQGGMSAVEMGEMIGVGTCDTIKVQIG